MGKPGCRSLVYCIDLPVMCGVPLLFPPFFCGNGSSRDQSPGGGGHASLHSKYDAMVRLFEDDSLNHLLPLLFSHSFSHRVVYIISDLV